MTPVPHCTQATTPSLVPPETKGTETKLGSEMQTWREAETRPVNIFQFHEEVFRALRSFRLLGVSRQTKFNIRNDYTCAPLRPLRDAPWNEKYLQFSFAFHLFFLLCAQTSALCAFLDFIMTVVFFAALVSRTEK